MSKKYKQYKKMYVIPFSAFIGYLTSLRGREMSLKQALLAFGTHKKYFINYILKTSNIKGIKDIKIMIDRPIEV